MRLLLTLLTSYKGRNATYLYYIEKALKIKKMYFMFGSDKLLKNYNLICHDLFTRDLNIFIYNKKIKALKKALLTICWFFNKSHFYFVILLLFKINVYIQNCHIAIKFIRPNAIIITGHWGKFLLPESKTIYTKKKPNIFI